MIIAYYDMENKIYQQIQPEEWWENFSHYQAMYDYIFFMLYKILEYTVEKVLM